VATTEEIIKNPGSYDNFINHRRGLDGAEALRAYTSELAEYAIALARARGESAEELHETKPVDNSKY
jgi:hypothetical protein